MNHNQLQRGQEIQDELRNLNRVLEHLSKWASGKDDPIDFVVKYLKECRMVGTDAIREHLAIGFIEESKRDLGTLIKLLDEEFEKL